MMLETRKRPAGNRPSPKSRDADYHHSSGDDRHSTLTADERREEDLLAELKERGYGITMPCLICRRPLTAAKSLAAHVGPVCAARMAEAVTE